MNNSQHNHVSSKLIPNKVCFVEIDDNHVEQRLDNFLMTLLKGVPKTYIYRIIRKGEVRINKARAKPSSRLEIGDLVRIPPIRMPGETNKRVLVPEKYQFLNDTILYEDDDLLVLNKPSGLAVHAGSGIQTGLIEALRAVRTDCRFLELAHRLDRETSGCLVLAKNRSSLKKLHEDFKTNSAKNALLNKRYQALVMGQWQGGKLRVTKPLLKNMSKSGERVVVVNEEGSYASSIFTPVKIYEQASLLEVKLLTGRTHQVRVHAQSEGHPLAGDEKYGDKNFNKVIQKSGLKRLFLHASQIEFNHPKNDQRIKISCPLADELEQVLKKIEG